jgi:pimeloyl-ACP methyl ester carboxylesterase
VQCFATLDDEEQFLAGLPAGFPVGGAEARVWIRGFAGFGQQCLARHGDLLAHVSTAASAKDLDLLRQAVGDPQLTYFGNSYGTFLGAIYANLFPDQVGAMVLSANVDPVARTNGGDDTAVLSMTLREGTDKAFAKVLDAFLDLCGQASTAQCAFSAGSAAATREKWTALLQRLRDQPVTGGTPPQTFTYAALVSNVILHLYVVAEWPPTAELLEDLWKNSDPRGGPTEPTAAAAGRGASAGPEERYVGLEQQLAITCAEAPNPRHPRAYRGLAALAYARAGDVGPAWTWNDEQCAEWPATAADRYVGPWDRPTAHPILVIGNTFDPATRYEGAVAMANLLAHARLLTVDGYGHSILRNPSTCAHDHVSRYFIDGTLPPEGTVCPQDQPPFTTSPAP